VPGFEHTQKGIATMDEVIKILLQGLAAAAAGYFGVVSGLSRFRGEKALEARLDWYRRATQHYAKVKWDIEVARSFMVEGEDWGRLWIKVREEGYIPLTLLEVESRLFASPLAVDTVARLGDAFDKISELTECFESSYMVENLDDAIALREHLDVAIESLAQDVRRQLRYETLPTKKAGDKANQGQVQGS
jgi:hypothetical protein